MKTPCANDRHRYRGEHPWFDNAESCAWCGARCKESFCSDECEDAYKRQLEKDEEGDRKFRESIGD